MVRNYLLKVITFLPVMLAGLGLLLIHGPASATVTPPDYGAATQAFADTVTPMITAMVPILVVVLAITFGPSLLKRLIKKFAGG